MRWLADCQAGLKKQLSGSTRTSRLYFGTTTYQALLEQKTLEWLDTFPDFFDHAIGTQLVSPTTTPKTDFSDVLGLIEPPPDEPEKRGRRSEARARPTGIDFVRRDADNRLLGRMGEEWAVEFEQRRLHDAERRPDLAKNLVWVSRDEGDGLGYDIRSFEGDGRPRLIEVKTTGLGKYFPFYVSANEVNVSRREAASYHLYRVFSFSTQPRLYNLRGSLETVCLLTPAVYSASPSRQ